MSCSSLFLRDAVPSAFRLTAALALAAAASACSLSKLVDAKLPSGVSDPAAVNTRLGAIDRYKGAIFQFGAATSGMAAPQTAFIVSSGMLADELGSGQYNTPSSGTFTNYSVIDSRAATGDQTASGLDDLPKGTWSGLSAVRIRVQDAIPAVQTYAPNEAPDLVAHLHALAGMSETMLAELYCSGIVLTTINAGGGFTYGNTMTSEDVYTHALAQFDSALALVHDSTRIKNFIMVGRGRVLLDLGRYADAAAAVADVPTDFTYDNLHSLGVPGGVGVANFTANAGLQFGYGTLVDHEGGNGINYLSANDPRVTWTDRGPDNGGIWTTHVLSPDKWAKPDASKSVTIANGVEARLIEAEALLKANNASGWAAKLNDLRATAVTPAMPALPADSTTGATAALQLKVMFRERAMWLYLTGHRQGDMRRLVRQYGLPQDQVYPTGSYPAGPLGNYGTFVNFPAPQSEIASNPNFHGCINRDA